MRTVVRWAIANAPGMNILVVGVVCLGLLSLFSLRRETFPEFELEIVLVSVPYPGADPGEVETAICQKVEEAVGAIAGIKEMTSIAQENLGSVLLEIDPSVPDVGKALDEIRSEVDRISTFPVQAEDPEVKQITFRDTAIKLGVLGPEDASPAAELRLREVAERVREQLLLLDTVTQAEIQGAKEYEIDVEIPEETLRRYGLSLKDVAQAVRRENLDLPGGLLKSASQDVLLKGENKAVVGEEIGKVPLVSDASGVSLSVGDVAHVKDAFADVTSVTRVNGRPAMVIAVQRTSKEDLIAVTDAVKSFAKDYALPAGFELMTWEDRSIEVRDRIDLLAKNGIQGLILVFVTLALFLNLRLAFWVAIGIPISMLGACIVLLMTGQTINMLSLFGFLMVIGILVDDAIVIGENIYVHRELGKDPLAAAVDGTIEVLPSVLSSVATTVMAFVPLMFVSGVMGKFVAVLPVAAIACLCISLVEASLVLPVHLRHEPHESLLRRAWAVRSRMTPLWRWTLGPILIAGAAAVTFVVAIFTPIGAVLTWLNPRCCGAFDALVARFYVPALRSVLKNPGLTICGAITILLLTAGLVAHGTIRTQFFPDLDAPRVQATVTFPDGTPESVTRAAVARMKASLMQVDAVHVHDTSVDGGPITVVQEEVGYVTGQGPNGQRSQSTGSHLGRVEAEMLDPSLRSVSSVEIMNEWRKASGEFPGAESVNFESPSFGPAGKKIEFKLLADRQHAAELDAAVEAAKAKLGSYPGVFDVDDDSRPGKVEIRIRLKPAAVALGVTQADLFETVRAAYFGDEVMRVQRGRHEVKIMVRLPASDRRSFADFDEIRQRVADPTGGSLREIPIRELADVTIARGPSEINRVDRMRSITVYCDVDLAIASAGDIAGDLEAKSLAPILKDYPHIGVRWKGQQQQQAESQHSMLIGGVCAIAGMFALLALEFKSYLQPLLILMIVPFGVVGALLGHGLLDIPVSFFSTMGLIALTGVVVNDSIVLVDFVNAKLKEGLPLNDALFEAGTRRVRPVFLTSATTVLGMAPMVFETSFQAQILVPMAAAICFGLMMTTGLVLLLLPAVYSAYGGLVGLHETQEKSGGDSSSAGASEIDVSPSGSPVAAGV